MGSHWMIWAEKVDVLERDDILNDLKEFLITS